MPKINIQRGSVAGTEGVKVGRSSTIERKSETDLCGARSFFYALPGSLECSASALLKLYVLYTNTLYSVSAYVQAKKMLRANPRPCECHVTLERRHSDAREVYHWLRPRNGIG